MIIDLNTHIWSSLDQFGTETAERYRTLIAERWGGLDASPLAHERAMECVDASFVIGFASDRLGASVPNEYIAEYVAKDSGRVGVAGIDPMSEDAMDRIDRASELGLVAIAVSPSCQGFHPAHSRAMQVYERAAELSMPVFVTTLEPMPPSAMLEFARPGLWDEVARNLPELPILFGQLGAPWVDETLLLLSKHQHVFAEISGVVGRRWQLYNALLSARGIGVMDKLLFGSGFPFQTPSKAIETLYSLGSMSQGTMLPTIPRAEVNAIVERDAFVRLGLEPVHRDTTPDRPRHASGEPMMTPMVEVHDHAPRSNGAGTTATDVHAGEDAGQDDRG